MKHSKLTALLLCVVALLVTGCGGAIDATIGGTVSGLSGGTTVGLLDNGTDALTVSASGSFAFANQVQAGSTFSVTVSAEPLGETCVVENGVGTVSQNSGDVTNIVVSCNALASPNNEVSVSVSGLATGAAVTLLNNGADTLTVNTNGLSAFSTPLVVGAPYSVVVSVQPVGQTCVVANATGVIPSSGTIPFVTVTCS